MSYTIRTCKICNKKIHIRQKGRSNSITNRCIHFKEQTYTLKQIEDKTIPIRTLLDLPNTANKPYLCVKHGTPLRFMSAIGRFTNLYYCDMCNKIDRLIPQLYIKRWKKQTWNSKWKTGDVKLTISLSYKEIMEKKIT